MLLYATPCNFAESVVSPILVSSSLLQPRLTAARLALPVTGTDSHALIPSPACKSRWCKPTGCREAPMPSNQSRCESCVPPADVVVDSVSPDYLNRVGTRRQVATQSTVTSHVEVF